MRSVNKFCVVVATLSLCTSLVGCSTQQVSEASVQVVDSCPTCSEVPPGVTQYVWEEPMVDVVEVPPGLDPEGRYYRPAHQEVVEVRQGRWKYYNKNK